MKAARWTLRLLVDGAMSGAMSGAMPAGALAGVLGCILTGTLTGCSWLPTRQAAEAVPVQRQPAARTTAADGTAIITSAGVEIEKMPFRAGVSSATVERLARQQGCEGGLGASLVSEPGPVEIYRMACSNGKIFLARCELRQCTPGIKPNPH